MLTEVADCCACAVPVLCRAAPVQDPGFQVTVGVTADDEGLTQQKHQDLDSRVQLMSSLPAVRLSCCAILPMTAASSSLRSWGMESCMVCTHDTWVTTDN